MAQEIREFAVTVPAGTPKTAPQVTDVSFPDRIVTAVSWRVPPGPGGLMGWALTSAGAPVIPVQQGAYIVTDNQSATWDLEGYLDSGNWQVTAYNTGIYPHTVYLTFLLDLIGAASGPPPPAAGGGVTVTVGSTGSVIPSGTQPAQSPAAPPTAVIMAAVAAAWAQAAAAAGLGGPA